MSFRMAARHLRDMTGLPFRAIVNLVGARTCLVLLIGAADQPGGSCLDFQADKRSAISFRVLQLTGHEAPVRGFDRGNRSSPTWATSETTDDGANEPSMSRGKMSDDPTTNTVETTDLCAGLMVCDGLFRRRCERNSYASHDSKPYRVAPS